MWTKALLALVPLLSYAQGVTGIVSGYVFDHEAKVIRPVNGLPGAALLGDPLDFGLPAFHHVEFTGQDLAYAASGGGQFYRVHLSTSSAELLTGTLPGGRLAAPGLIWYRDSRQLQFMTDGSQVFVASAGSLTTAALNPVTGCAVLAFDSGTIESVCGVNQFQLFEDSSAKIVSLAFTSTSTYALDSANNRIIQLNSASSQSILAAGFTQPVGLAAINNSLLAIADAGTQQMTFIALNDTQQQPDPIALLFAPTELQPLSGKILRLGKAGASPFEVVDFNQNNRNFFVPAISAKGAN